MPDPSLLEHPLEWLGANWGIVFSGIGVPVVTGVFGLLWHRRRKAKRKAAINASNNTYTAEHSPAAMQGVNIGGNATIAPQIGGYLFNPHQLIEDYAKAKAEITNAHQATEAARREAAEAAERAKQNEQQLAEALRALEEERRKHPADAPSIDAAFDAMKHGRTGEAEAIFTDILTTKEAAGHQTFKEAATAARHLGALAFLHDTKKALAAYRKAVDLDPDEPDGWNQLGHLLLRVGNLDEAERAYEKVLALGNRTKKRGFVAAATGNLGLIHGTRGDLDTAEAFHRKALDLEIELGRKEGMASQYGNLGLIHRTRGDLDTAEAFHRKALDLHRELGHKEGMASDYGNLGAIYKARGDLRQAEAHWRQALDLFRAIGMKPEVERTQRLLDGLTSATTTSRP